MNDAAFPHLRNAPATEAVIDIRMHPRPDADPELLRKLVIKDYSVEEVREYSSQIELKAGGPPKVMHRAGPTGFRLTSPDGRVVVTATLAGIATSRLSPYTAWEDLVDTARTFSEAYSRLVRPEAAIRLGVRYINRLDLPVHREDLERYLVTPPETYPGTSGVLNGFLKRVVTAEDGGVTAIVTQALQESKERSTVLILDIDCALTRSFEPDDPTIWKSFADLRTRKNRVFFGNLTQQALELYL